MQDASLFLNAPLLPIRQPNTTARESASRSSNAPASSAGASFAQILNEKQSKIAFSQHALERIQSRGIHFTEADVKRLDDVVGQMAEKGARESLVYMNGTALVVSVKNRTVITAMEGSSAKQNIFTNIDSAAIL